MRKLWNNTSDNSNPCPRYPLIPSRLQHHGAFLAKQFSLRPSSSVSMGRNMPIMLSISECRCFPVLDLICVCRLSVFLHQAFDQSLRFGCAHHCAASRIAFQSPLLVTPGLADSVDASVAFQTLPPDHFSSLQRLAPPIPASTSGICRRFAPS